MFVSTVWLRVDEVALGHQLARDAPGDRRFDAGEFQFEFGLAERRLGTIEFRASGAIGRAALVEQLIGDVAGASERLGPLEIVRREIDAYLRRRDRRLGLFERSLIGALIDGEQESPALTMAPSRN